MSIEEWRLESAYFQWFLPSEKQVYIVPHEFWGTLPFGEKEWILFFFFLFNFLSELSVACWLNIRGKVGWGQYKKQRCSDWSTVTQKKTTKKNICSVITLFPISSVLRFVRPLVKLVSISLTIFSSISASILCVNKQRRHHMSSDDHRPMRTAFCPVGSKPLARCVRACLWTPGLARCASACECQRRMSR